MEFKPILKGLGKVIGGTLLVILLSFAVMTYGLKNLSAYDNFKPIFVDTIISTMGKESGNEQFNSSDFQKMIEIECSKKSTVIIPLGDQGFAGMKELEVSCEKISQTSPNKMFNLFAESLFDKFYYKQYNCSVIECFQSGGDNTLALVSEQGHKFYTQIFWYVVLATVFAAFILVISSSTVYGAIQGIGSASVVAGLNYFLIKFAQNLVPGEAAQAAGPALAKVFGFFETGFIILLVGGAALFIIGFIWKIVKKKEQQET